MVVFGLYSGGHGVVVERCFGLGLVCEWCFGLGLVCVWTVGSWGWI